MTQVPGVNHSSLPFHDGLAASPHSGERFLISGSSPGWVLEAQLDVAKMPPSSSTLVVVVCHPHPLHGGTLTNKVVHMVAKVFAELGVEALRFNFRGVGRSSGIFDHGVGEVGDLQAAVDWLRVRQQQQCLISPLKAVYGFPGW